MKKYLPIVEFVMIIAFAFIPLFGRFPYRINIFLSYEGAYRLYLNQVPFKDFGIPLGYMYWVVPGIFFKVFGPYMMSLVKAQVFLNIISGLAFRSILKSLSLQPGLRFLSLLVFIVSYSQLNYWPWYNHTVIVYELVSLACLMKYMFPGSARGSYLWLVTAGVFAFFSFFTKQDAGLMGFMIGLGIICYNAFVERKWIPPLVFAGSAVATGLIIILPLLKYQFGYWFNHGQPPHTSRISFGDIAEDFFDQSAWIRFYLFIILLLLIPRLKSFKTDLLRRKPTVFALLTIGILVEAAVFQTTSYIPADNNIFFHSFSIAFILFLLSGYVPLNVERLPVLGLLSCGILLWWGNVYWKYVAKFVVKPVPVIANNVGIVNKHTYLILAPDTTDVPMNKWRTPALRSFGNMLLPGPTVDGIERLMKMPMVKQRHDLKVLNMTELTPLAYEMQFSLEKSDQYPLWYHQGVGMFQKQTDEFCSRITNNYYDLVMFEYIPYLNNFYPFQVRDALEKYYKKVDSFTAPRKPSIQAWVEIYVKKQ